MNLKESYEMINKIWRNLKYHVGRGGDAHPPVNDFLSGFMTPEQNETLKLVSGYKQPVSAAKGKDIDVLDLEPGIYEISGAINNPVSASDESWIEYIVRASEGTQRKTIEATLSTNGHKFLRTIHTSGTPESGTGKWLKIYPLTEILWGGYQATGVINLSGRMSEYKAIEILYTSDQGQGVAKYAASDKQTTYRLSVAGYNDNLQPLQNYVYEATVETTSDTQLEIKRNAGLVLPEGEHLVNKIYIMHVLGIR